MKKLLFALLAAASIAGFGGVVAAEDFSGGACNPPVAPDMASYCAVYGPNGSYSQTYGKGGTYCQLYGYNC